MASRLSNIGLPDGLPQVGALLTEGLPKVGALPTEDLSKVLEIKGTSGYILGGLPLKRDKLGTGPGDILNSRTCLPACRTGIRVMAGRFRDLPI